MQYDNKKINKKGWEKDEDEDEDEGLKGERLENDQLEDDQLKDEINKNLKGFNNTLNILLKNTNKDWEIKDTETTIILSKIKESFNNPTVQKIIFGSLNILVDIKTWLPNIEQLKIDLKENNSWNKNLCFIKINDFHNINYNESAINDIMEKIISNLSKIFWKLWFKIYKIDELTFAFLKITKDNESPENINDQLLTDIIESKINNLKIWCADWDELIHLNIKWWVSKWVNTSIKNCLIALWNPQDINKSLSVYTKIIWYNHAVSNEKKYLWKILVTDAIKNWYLVWYYQELEEVNNVNKWNTKKYEVLMRIDDWEWNIEVPNAFIDSINWTHLMKKSTIIIINKTLEKLVNSNHTFSINLWENELNDDEIIDFICSQIIEKELDPSRLTIEIHEDTKVFNNKNINKLRKIWIKIALDDFWKWFTNIEKINKWITDIVKIDIKLIKWILKDIKKRLTVKCIIDIARTQDVQICAEWVEDKETYDYLKMLGVDYIQWYHISKPLSWEKLEENQKNTNS